MTTVYDFSAQTIDGQSQALDAYRGQVLLIVNVASQCGWLTVHMTIWRTRSSIELDGLQPKASRISPPFSA